MATTVTAADLNVTITESITLNGVVYGNTKTTTITSNTKAEQRIMNIAGRGASGDEYTTIVGFGSADSASDVRAADFKYVRITNLDSATDLTLRLNNGTDFVYMPVEAGDSIVLMGSGIDHTATSGGDAANTLVAFTAIAAQAQHASTSVDIEFLVVTA